jgi:hypothetical protein
MVGELRLWAQYTLLDLQVENNQETALRKATSAQKWLEQKTDSLRQDEGTAAILDEMTYAREAGIAHPHEGNVQEHAWIESAGASRQNHLRLAFHFGDSVASDLC